MTARARSLQVVGVLAASLLGGDPAGYAQLAPPVTRDTSAARVEKGIDPAILWTYDTGG